MAKNIGMLTLEIKFNYPKWYNPLRYILWFSIIFKIDWLSNKLIESMCSMEVQQNV